VMQSQIQATDDHAARHALQRTCDKWIAKHDLLGPLRDFGTHVRGRHAEVTWRYGFIRCLEIGWGDQVTDTPEEASRTLAEILRHPSSPFITLLVLGPAPGRGTGRGRGRMDMQCLVDAIVETGCPKNLRTLHLGKLCDWPLRSAATGNIGEASAALARLQKLTLEAGTVTIGQLAMPELEELRITCFRLDAQDVEDLCRIKCPRLKTLRIASGSAPENTDAELRRRLKHVKKITVTRPADLND